MRNTNNIIKILIIPLSVCTLIILAIETGLSANFFQSLNINYSIYKLFYHNKEVITFFDTIGICYMLTGIIGAFLLLIFGFFIKNKYFRIGNYITIGGFICIFFLGIYLHFF
jgi:hypothetical protein